MDGENYVKSNFLVNELPPQVSQESWRQKNNNPFFYQFFWKFDI